MKICRKCGIPKPATEYHRKRSGLNAQCRDCTNARTAAYRAVNGKRYQERNVRLYWQDPVKARFLASVHQKVRRAVKNGILIRPSSCSECGRVGKIEAAHEDYSRPLDVRWLCHGCHVRWDRAAPKS